MGMVVGTVVLAVAIGGCQSNPLVSNDSGVDGGLAPVGTGTLVYAERGTQNIRILDLGTGHDALIDSGMFGGVSIAPDGKHVAYAGIERVVKIADRAGAITPVQPGGGGCASTGDWLSSSALTYCISDAHRQGTMLLPALDGTPPRYLDGNGVAVSADGSLDAYVGAHGDLFVERVDGSEHRVLVPSPNPTAMYPAEVVTGFTPGNQAVLVTDSSTYPTRLHIVAIADGSSVDVDDVYFGGTPFGAPIIRGASAFSTDGSEILMQSTTALVAVSLTTGAKRTIVAFPDRVSSGGAVFLDADHVLWVRIEDRSYSDIGQYALSLHVIGPTPTDDVVLDDPNAINRSWPMIAVSPQGFIALPSDVLLVKPDGTVLLRNDVTSESTFISDILGLTESGDVIASSYAGDVRYISADGTVRDLAAASRGGGDLLGPFAAFAPTGD